MGTAAHSRVFFHERKHLLSDVMVFYKTISCITSHTHTTLTIISHLHPVGIDLYSGESAEVITS